MSKGLCAGVCLLACVLVQVVSGAEGTFADAQQWLKDAGAVEFSHKEGVSRVLKDVYLGYDTAGKIVVGVAGRQIKSYEKIDIYVAVVPDGAGYKVAEVGVPDLATKIAAGSKLDNVNSALKAVNGAVLVGPDGAFKRIDAVTGATRYHKAVYSGYDRLSEELVELMKQNPEWPKQKL